MIQYTHKNTYAHTPTSDSTVGWDHKSKASSSLAVKKTGMFFTHQKGNKLCLTGSNTLERLATWGEEKKKKAAHLPFTLGYGSKICGNSTTVYVSLLAYTYSTLQPQLHQAHCQQDTAMKCLLLPLLTSVTTNHITSWSLNMAICIHFHTAEADAPARIHLPVEIPLIHMHNCHHYLP